MAYTSAQIVQAVPTGINSALVCVKAETAFTAVASLTADNLFTSTYTNYKIVMRVQSSAASSMNFVLRVGGVSSTTGYNDQRLYVDGTTNVAGRSSNQSSQRIGDCNGAFFAVQDMNLFSVFTASPTNFHFYSQTTYGGYDITSIVPHWGNHNVSTAYDGFSIAVGSGTITGTYTVYGFAKAV